MTRFPDIEQFPVNLLTPKGLEKRNLKSGVKPWFTTGAELDFASDIARGVICVPSNYLTDLASIPQQAQGLFMLHDSPQIALGAIIHDWLYQNKGRIQVIANGREMPMLLSREQCDHILCHEAMRDLGASEDQVETVYTILRTVGDGWGDNYPLSERFSL